MNKNVLLIALMLSMCFVSLQIAEPAAAASLKVVDHGSMKLNVNNVTGTYTWKTYQRGTSYVEMIGYAYSPKTKVGVYTYVYIQKVSKTIVKSYGKDVIKYSGHSQTIKISPQYCYTKLTAAQCYWRYFKPALLSDISKGL